MQRMYASCITLLACWLHFGECLGIETLVKLPRIRLGFKAPPCPNIVMIYGSVASELLLLPVCSTLSVTVIVHCVPTAQLPTHVS